MVLLAECLSPLPTEPNELDWKSGLSPNKDRLVEHLSAFAIAGQKRIKALEAQQNEKRRTLFDAQDQVDRQRGELTIAIEGKMRQRLESTMPFNARWSLR